MFPAAVAVTSGMASSTGMSEALTAARTFWRMSAAKMKAAGALVLVRRLREAAVLKAMRRLLPEIATLEVR